MPANERIPLHFPSPPHTICHVPRARVAGAESPTGDGAMEAGRVIRHLATTSPLCYCTIGGPPKHRRCLRDHEYGVPRLHGPA